MPDVESIEERVVEYSRPVFAAATHPPLRLRPSDAVFDGSVEIAEVTRLGDRIVLVGDPDLQALGEAIHRFLAADDRSWDRPMRTDIVRPALHGPQNVYD
jgi:ATP-dependent helicase/nuclease subunit A